MSVGNIFPSKNINPLQIICHVVIKGAGKMFGNFQGVKNSKSEMKSQVTKENTVSNKILYTSKGDKIFPNTMKLAHHCEPLYAQVNKEAHPINLEQDVKPHPAGVGGLDNLSNFSKPAIIKPELLKVIMSFKSSINTLKPNDKKGRLAKQAICDKLVSMTKDPEAQRNLIKINWISHKLNELISSVKVNNAKERLEEFSKFKEIFIDEANPFKLHTTQKGFFLKHISESEA